MQNKHTPGEIIIPPSSAFAMKKAGYNFQYAGAFTEIVLLGNVAYRVGQAIQYDPATMKVTNVPEANALLTKSYRKGWEVREG